MKPKKLRTLADLAEVAADMPQAKPQAKIVRVPIHVDVDDFHILAKAVQVYLGLVKAEEKPDPAFVTKIEKLDSYFQKGTPL